MKIYRLTVFICALIFLPCGIPRPVFAQGKQWVHPRNKIISRLFPRPFKLRFPEIPRFTPQEALTLFKTNQALFIHVGEAGGNVPGCLHISEKTAANLDPNKLLRKVRRKYVILY